MSAARASADALLSSSSNRWSAGWGIELSFMGVASGDGRRDRATWAGRRNRRAWWSSQRARAASAAPAAAASAGERAAWFLSLILWRALLATPLHLTRCRKTFFTADFLGEPRQRLHLSTRKF